MDFLAKRDITRTHFIAMLTAFVVSVLGSATLLSLFSPTWNRMIGAYGYLGYGDSPF